MGTQGEDDSLYDGRIYVCYATVLHTGLITLTAAPWCHGRRLMCAFWWLWMGS